MFITCSNGAVTPAQEPLVRCATKILILEAMPTGSSSDVVSDARPNHDYCGGYNTNLLWLFKIWNDMFFSPAISNGVVYIGSDHGHGYALE